MFSDRNEVSVNYLNQPLFLKSHQTFLLIKMLTMDLPTPLKPFDSKKWLVLEVSPHGSIVKQRGDEKEKNINIIPRIISFFTFFILHGRKTSSFLLNSVIVTLKSWSQLLLQKWTESQQKLLSMGNAKINGKVIK